LFPGVNLLKCVITEILFSTVAKDTADISQGSVATHLRCGEIFSDNIITKSLLILTVKFFLNIGQYVMKLLGVHKYANFLGHPVCNQMQGARASPILVQNMTVTAS